MTPEERKRRCVELCVQAQHMDSEQYLRMMHDSTKRPWVGLTDEDIFQMGLSNYIQVIREAEAKLKEKNT